MPVATYNSKLETRLAALESQVAELTDRLERAEGLSAIRRGYDQAMRGEGVPARQALEALRKKYKISTK